jgi:Transposase, Mutator family
MVTFAAHASGQREPIGVEIPESETEAGWAAFLRELRARGLERVRLCISDDHPGLKAAEFLAAESVSRWAFRVSAQPMDGAATTDPAIATVTPAGHRVSRRWRRHVEQPYDPLEGVTLAPKPHRPTPLCREFGSPYCYLFGPILAGSDVTDTRRGQRRPRAADR